MLKKALTAFTDHPKSNSMTYLQHFAFAVSTSVLLIWTGVVGIIHAIFPFLFKTDTTDTIRYLNSEMRRR